MIPLFRKIRKKMVDDNKPLTYMKYAIGEIALVVIGILIALQINSWDLKKQQQNNIKENAKLLIQDLEEDIIEVELNIAVITEISTKIDSLAISVHNRKIEDISNIDFLCLTWNVLYRPYIWNRTTFIQLENSGSLQYIENVSLTKLISSYYAFTEHMDGDYLNDKSKSEHALQLISQVVNSNYSNIRELRRNVLVKTNNPEMSGFYYYKQPDYLKAKAQNLNLITNEINDVNKVISSLTRLQSYYHIRSEWELPQIINDAKELIMLLKEEYHE